MKKNNRILNNKEVKRTIKVLGMKRISSDFFNELEKIVKRKIETFVKRAIEEAKASGRRTLKKEDLANVDLKEERYFEI